MVKVICAIPKTLPDMFYYAILLTLFATTIHESCLVGGQLYTSSDPILQLNASTFHSTILGQRTAFLVEFYNSWCGHCIRYAPVYRSIAFDLIGWHPVLKVAALDCADEKNFEICREYKVPLFPTLKYFGPGLRKGDTGEPLDHKLENNVLRTNLINFLRRSPPQRGWPNLQLVDASGLRNFRKSIKQQPTLLILEPENSYIGLEVILDVSSLNVSVLRSSTSNSHFFLELKHHVTTMRPISLLHLQREKIKILSELNDLSLARAEFSTAIFNLLHIKPNQQFKLKEPLHNNAKSQKISDDALHMVDLENTLHYLLRTEVALKDTLREQTLKDFKAFLAALTKTFPGSRETMTHLRELHAWVNAQPESVQTKDLARAMDDIEERGNPLAPFQDWVHCQGSRSTFRGYPCGLWSLFHTMTVSAHKKYQRGEMVNPSQVLLSIRDYVASFFSCSECALHFARMAVGMEEELRAPNHTVLWLWNAHNKVNLRLAGDKTEDSEHPKVLFPTEIQCSDCRSGQTWHMDRVLRFMEDFYSVDIVRDDVAPDAIKAQSSTVNGFHFKYFSRADVSLCLVLYVSSAALLLIVYFVILLKRRQRRINYPV